MTRILSILSLVLMLISGCVIHAGTAAIQKATIQELRGQTKAELLMRYGTPASQQKESVHGQTHETWRWWYYREVLFTPVAATTLSVQFDELDVVISMILETLPPGSSIQ